jgi:AP-3 complex subunit beta
VRGKVIGNTVKRRVVRKAFYSDEEDELDEEDVEIEDNVDDNHSSNSSSVFAAKGPKSVVEEGEGLDSDHRLVLRSSLPLLKSRNAGVVLGVCSLHYYCGSHNASITQNVSVHL